MGEYVFSCACGYEAQHSSMKEVLKLAEKHSLGCSMAWDMDVQSIEASIGV
jgi:hypothetical protein